MLVLRSLDPVVIAYMRFAIAAAKKRAKPQFSSMSAVKPVSRLYGWLAARSSNERLLVMLAVLVSVCAYAWYSSHGLTLGYADALSRMTIARRVISSRTPGLAQLGTTWLPLHTVLMLPLIWNDTLFHDGFAGSFPSMAAYVIASLYMFRMCRILFGSHSAAWIGAIAFMLNPNVVYMQSTAMSEVPLLCTAIVAVYYMLLWAKSYCATDLVKSATAAAAGVGIRYDGWALAGGLAVIVIYLAWRHQGYQGAEAWSIGYGVLAFSGCVAWVIYNAVIFHDPTLFLFYGSKKHDTSYMAEFPSYHRPWFSFEMYGYTVTAMVGWAVMLIVILGLAVFLFRYRLRTSTLPVYALLIPFAFYWLIFYMGVDTILLPELGLSIYWNARFGLELIPAVSLFLACLASVRRILFGIASAAILVFIVISSTGQTPLALREVTFKNSATPVPHMREAAHWFLQHYRSGNILVSYVPDAPLMFYMMQRIPDHAFITDANGRQYTQALHHPQRELTWIVLSFYEGKEENSPIWKGLHGQQDWKQHFVLRKEIFSKQGSTMVTQFYERVGSRDVTHNEGDSIQAIKSARGNIKSAVSRIGVPRDVSLVSLVHESNEPTTCYRDKAVALSTSRADNLSLSSHFDLSSAAERNCSRAASTCAKQEQNSLAT